MVLLELLGEITAEVLVEELLKKVTELGRRVTEFKGAAERLERTLRDISPLIQDIEHQSHALGRQPGVQQRLAEFKESLEKGQEFVFKCSKVRRWKIWKNIQYKKGLDKLDESVKSFKEYMLILMARDAGETLLLLKRIQLFLPDCTRLTVTIAQNEQVRVIIVDINCPMYDGITLNHNFPKWPLLPGLPHNIRIGNTSIGHTLISCDFRKFTLRGTFVNGKCNECTIAADRNIINHGCILRFIARNGTMATFAARSMLHDPGHSYWVNDGSVRRCTLYDGLVWLENPQQQSTRRDSPTIYIGNKGLRSNLPWIPSSTITFSLPSSKRLIAASEIQNKLCYCGSKAALWHSDLESSSHLLYNYKENKCRYLEYHMLKENETSTTGEVISYDNSYVTIENETNTIGKDANHVASINSNNREKENDDIEEMSRKCGSLMEQLHVLQGIVNGQQQHIATIVMICFLSLITNFVILMYK